MKLGYTPGNNYDKHQLCFKENLHSFWPGSDKKLMWRIANEVTKPVNCQKLLQVNEIVRFSAIFYPPIVRIYFTAPAVLLKFTLLCINVIIGIFP